MPARTVRCGSLSYAALLCVLWLMASSTAFCQATQSNTDIQDGDVTPNKGEKDTSIPPGLIQNRQVLPEMEIDDERYTDGQETEFQRKSKTAFEKALGSSNLTDEEKKLLDAGAKYWVYRFSMKKYREEEAPKKEERPAPGTPKTPAAPKDRLHDLRKRLLDLIKVYAKTPVAREYFLKQVTKECEQLLDNNYVVRQNIILLLGTLSSSYPPPAKNIEPTPYDPAYAVLLKVIKDDKQHEALKVDAVVGLLRICRLGLPLSDGSNDKKRAEIAMTLVPELAKKNTHWWYQARLAECLGAAGVTYDPTNKTNPIVLQTLAEVVADDQRHFQARIEAAKAIGRLPLDNQLNITPVVYHIVNLGYQIVQAHNANPKKEPWGNYFFTLQPQLGFGLYYAFRAESGNARILGGKRKPGLLEAFPGVKEVQEAYGQVLTMTLHFIDNPGKQVAGPQLQGIDTWLKTHVPANNRITQQSPPLVGSKPEAANENGRKAAVPQTSAVAGER